LFGCSLAYLLMARHWKAAVVAYAFMAAMACLAAAWVALLALMIPEMMRKASAWSFAIPFLRGLTMMNVLLPLAFTTRIQSVLWALEGLHLPFAVYLPCTVMVRFIPSFASDVRQVWEALKIRGWNTGIWHCLMHPVETTRLLFVPLLFLTLKTSDDLGIAAEFKGLRPGRPHESYTTSRLAAADAVALALAAARPRWCGCSTGCARSITPAISRGAPASAASTAQAAAWMR
ncbi:MAG: energy-coupling factor transporter transmembrane component T, partial [Succinivibrio sp.]